MEGFLCILYFRKKTNENDAVDGKENVGYDYSPIKDERVVSEYLRYFQ